MIISINAEKALDKIQDPFKTKAQQSGYTENIHQYNTAIHEKLTANIILNSEKLKAFPLRSGIKRMPTLTICV